LFYNKLLAVGKTNIVLRFVNGNFSEHHGVTIGGAFMAKLLITGDVSTRFMVKNNISSMSLKRSGIQLVKKNIDHWLQCIIKVI